VFRPASEQQQQQQQQQQACQLHATLVLPLPVRKLTSELAIGSGQQL
jgi:hypothetical protein